MRILFSVVFLLSVFASAKDINVNIANMVKDDEGVKIITTDSQNHMAIYYLAQSNDNFADISQKLQAAKFKKGPITLNVTAGEVSLIESVKEIKK
ncbi:hypothetical protein K2P97_06485 [bacterium]|nr:hypothetical protein [bacterium]